MDSATEFDNLLQEFNVLSAQIMQQSIYAKANEPVQADSESKQEIAKSSDFEQETQNTDVTVFKDEFDELLQQYELMKAQNAVQMQYDDQQNFERTTTDRQRVSVRTDEQNLISVKQNDVYDMDQKVNSRVSRPQAVDQQHTNQHVAIASSELEQVEIEEPTQRKDQDQQLYAEQGVQNDEYALLLSKVMENQAFLQENENSTSQNHRLEHALSNKAIEESSENEPVPCLIVPSNAVQRSQVQQQHSYSEDLQQATATVRRVPIQATYAQQHQSIVFPPSDPSGENLQQFRVTAKVAFNSAKEAGNVTKAVLERIRQNNGQLSRPPGLYEVLLIISRNTSFSELSKQYSKKAFSMSKTELNFASFSELVPQNEAFLDQLADIFLAYSSITGYQQLVPVTTLKSQYHEVSEFFKRNTPRIAMGSTIGLEQMQQLMRDTMITHILSKGRLSALFTRAVFCQGKYIADYVQFNQKKHIPKVQQMESLNFDFLAYSNIAVSTDASAKKPMYAPSGRLCFFGFLSFILLLAVEFCTELNSELDTTKNEDNSPKTLSQLGSAAGSSVRGAKSVVAPRDPFMQSFYSSVLCGTDMSGSNYSYFEAWRSLFRFAQLIDMVLIPNAKIAGIASANEAMCRSVPTCHRKIVQHYYPRLRLVYQACCRGAKTATLSQLLQAFGRSQISHILSKTFFAEFVLRNFTELSPEFEPTLSFEEFVNLIFVAGNFAFGSGTYARFLRDSGERFQHAIRDVTGAV